MKQKSKSTLKYHVKLQPRRKDSFWFDGHVATLKNDKVKIDIMATGHLDVFFGEKYDTTHFENADARKEAKKREYTDLKLYHVGKNDGFRNNNWFGFMVGDVWRDETASSISEAVKMAEGILEELSEKEFYNNKITASFINPNICYIVFDDEKRVIGVVKNKTTDKKQDVSLQIMQLISDEFNADDIEFEKTVHLEHHMENVSVRVEAIEDGEESNREFKISGSVIY